jgi:hypothetical protein
VAPEEGEAESCTFFDGVVDEGLGGRREGREGGKGGREVRRGRAEKERKNCALTIHSFPLTLARSLGSNTNETVIWLVFGEVTLKRIRN